MMETIMKPFYEQPHRRQNPLNGEWVLVSPHRTQRPWQGQVEKAPPDTRPSFDPGCYLCPGNTRAGGNQNPDYTDTFVFTNDFAALKPESPQMDFEDHPLMRAQTVRGTCRVVCYSPRHDLSMAQMTHMQIRQVVDLWVTQIRELGSSYRWVQIFENKGAIMGCSNPHPHCQIWSSSSLPSIVLKEQESQADYLGQHGRPMLLDYLERELDAGVRVVYENDEFVALVPFWAVWPFEAMILPRKHVQSLAQFTVSQVFGLADAYRMLTRAYDKVFNCEFPYTAGIHQAPSDEGDHSAWQLHMHFYPPLLRSATVKKFMVGYEMLAAPQRDITAETAAETLRRSLAKAG
jgi:UDPglucose--hexose-1-phosphate uridylyltransferase